MMSPFEDCGAVLYRGAVFEGSGGGDPGVPGSWAYGIDDWCGCGVFFGFDVMGFVNLWVKTPCGVIGCVNRER